MELIGTRVGYTRTKDGKAAALSSVRADRKDLEEHVDSLEAASSKIAAELGALQGQYAGDLPIRRGNGSMIWPVNGPITGAFGEQRPGHMHAGHRHRRRRGHADPRRRRRPRRAHAGRRRVGRLRQLHLRPAHGDDVDVLRAPVELRHERRRRRSARARSSAPSATPVIRSARTCISRCASTASRSTRWATCNGRTPNLGRMQPEIDLLGLSLKTFGMCFGLAFVVSGAVVARRLKELGRPPDWAYEMVFAALIGGLVGARLYWILGNLGRGPRRRPRRRLRRLRARLVRRRARRRRGRPAVGAPSRDVQPRAARPLLAGARDRLRDRPDRLPDLRRRRLRRARPTCRGGWPTRTASCRRPTSSTRRRSTRRCRWLLVAWALWRARDVLRPGLVFAFYLLLAPAPSASSWSSSAATMRSSRGSPRRSC